MSKFKIYWLVMVVFACFACACDDTPKLEQRVAALEEQLGIEPTEKVTYLEKPCPWCNQYKLRITYHTTRRYIALCDHCEAQSPPQPSKDDVWNDVVDIWHRCTWMLEGGGDEPTNDNNR